MPGRWLTISSVSEDYQGYVCLPPSGSGPGIVLLHEIFGVNGSMREVAELYAEEGYVVLVPDLFWRIRPGIDLGYSEPEFEQGLAHVASLDIDRTVEDVRAAVAALRGLPECLGPVGALGFCLGGKLAYLAAARIDVDCAVSYYGVGIEDCLDEVGAVSCPIVFHFAGEDAYVTASARERIEAAFAGRRDAEFYLYSGCDHAFSSHARVTYNRMAAMNAHSRSIAAFRKAMGPHYDLATLWQRHSDLEFVSRSTEATMATMVAEPYVNHIPTMTGGVGQTELARFYENHFIHNNPDDAKLIPVSRTIGPDRLVDEVLFCFTHDREIDWMLPGVAPTGAYVEIPLVAIVNFRGDKLYHEHIYWDQASVLVQIGLLDPAGLPVAGIDTAKKLLDETRPSNTLMGRWAESAPPTSMAP